jgi:uncharacterized protein
VAAQRPGGVTSATPTQKRLPALRPGTPPASLRSAPSPRGGGILALLLALFLIFPTFAAELPKLTGRVVDDAGLIDPAAEAALMQKLADFQKKGSDQIVVATIPSLGGEEIEPSANRVFRAWGLGQAGEDNGVLLLVAQNDRKMRI